MNNKIWLIIKREYATRVRNKSFILSTILLPLIFILFIFGTAYLSVKSKGEKQHIAVDDESGVFKSSFKNKDNITYDLTTDVNANNFDEKGYSAFLHIPMQYASSKDSVTLISKKQLSLETEDNIRDAINDALKNKAFIEHNIDKRLLDSINNSDPDKMYNFSAIIRQGDKTEQSNALLSYGIGFGSGILIYLTLLIYGAAVMRGVMEEKTNRIAEVIISSVKPFQLMAGKIIGIAAVGLTQLLMWLVLVMILLGVSSLFLSPELLHNTQAMQSAVSAQPNATAAMQFFNAKEIFLSANWALIIPCFIFFFIGGYLFYASLFAAVGSVVNEDPQEAQALMLPITMPIILSFILMSAAVANPDSPMAVWGSIIPFSSPIVMMARIPSGNVPTWELILSMVLLVGGFIFTTYISAKIYRTGILLYGKKVTFKELGKWLFKRA